MVGILCCCGRYLLAFGSILECIWRYCGRDLVAVFLGAKTDKNSKLFWGGAAERLAEQAYDLQLPGDGAPSPLEPTQFASPIEQA